jgi:hypothetical protein
MIAGSMPGVTSSVMMSATATCVACTTSTGRFGSPAAASTLSAEVAAPLSSPT